MSALFQRRCANHAGREAAAQCRACARDFCRECVTEHNHRLICSACLRQLTAAAPRRPTAIAGLRRLGQGLAGLVLCWMFFNLLGRALLRLPSSFHEGTVWQNPDDQ